MTIIRTINGEEVKIELTFEEYSYIHEQYQKECDIEDIESYTEEHGVELTRKQMEIVQKWYRKLADWSIDIGEIKANLIGKAIEDFLTAAGL